MGAFGYPVVGFQVISIEVDRAVVGRESVAMVVDDNPNVRSMDDNMRGCLYSMACRFATVSRLRSGLTSYRLSANQELRRTSECGLMLVLLLLPEVHSQT